MFGNIKSDNKDYEKMSNEFGEGEHVLDWGCLISYNLNQNKKDRDRGISINRVFDSPSFRVSHTSIRGFS